MHDLHLALLARRAVRIGRARARAATAAGIAGAGAGVGVGTAGIATLHYNLPTGLVGGTVPVLLGGPVAPGATEIVLSGAAGTGRCVAAGTKITCREELADLGELPVSMAVVERVAAREYAGPASDRVAIANLFSSDPIGIVELDLSKPVVDDKPEGPDDGAHP